MAYKPKVLNLSEGGTNASLTTSNGGILYSTASAAAILSGTATANQALLSGSSTTPAWSTATYPATTTINRILYSSANNTISEITTANTGVLVTSSGGVPSINASTTSWTPAITFGGGNTGITYSQQIGQFYQLGQAVFFYFSMVLTAKGSSTGTMSITGLGAAGAPTPPQQAIFAVRCSNLTFSGMVNGRIAGGSLSIVLDNWASAGAVATLTDTAFANNTFIQGNGSYLIT